ncbi:MAG: hypothetical protein GXO15_00925, partial [Crenarchaeota archaeon]|nr:hypothetical protein [Thermoproteota archaeon]
MRVVRPGVREREFARTVVEKALEVSREALRLAGYEGFLLRVEGSYAKDTWLSGELEVDIFALFPREACGGVLEGFAGRVAPVLEGMGFRVELRYAQHPYARFYVDGVPVELVPGCRVSSAAEALTPVDRTPFHTEAVRRLLSPWQRDEVRLLKSFMKGVEVYGAEEAVRGFSGYLAELLVAGYGCFRGVLEAAASRWRRLPIRVRLPGVSVDWRLLERRYPDSVMYVPDPVDPARNAAAAVSRRSAALLALAAALYLGRGGAAVFFHRTRPPPPRLPPGEMGGRLALLYMVHVELDGVEPPETLWGVARRLGRVLAGFLEDVGVLVHRWEPVAPLEPGGWLAVVFEAEPGGAYRVREGPPGFEASRATRFVARHRWAPGGPWVGEDGLLYSLEHSVDVVDALRRGVETGAPGLVRRRARRVEVLRGLDVLQRLEERGVGRLWMVRLVRGRPYWLELL